jgi:hypothetical protein
LLSKGCFSQWPSFSRTYVSETCPASLLFGVQLCFGSLPTLPQCTSLPASFHYRTITPFWHAYHGQCPQGKQKRNATLSGFTEMPEKLVTTSNKRDTNPDYENHRNRKSEGRYGKNYDDGSTRCVA